MIEGSWSHDGCGIVPGMKNEQDEWDYRPHRSRLVAIGASRLKLFAKLYDEANTPYLQARLPVCHSAEIVQVLEKLAEHPTRLGDLKGQYFATQHWNETMAQDDGTIRRETRYPKSLRDWIVSGPHFHVGTPLNKTPDERSVSNRDYSEIDLQLISDNYLPRTNYVPACSSQVYLQRTPHWNGRPVTEYY